MSDKQSWIEHAYPLQQINITLQGTRHSDKSAIISMLGEVLERLKNDEIQGVSSDDDFGYFFEYNNNIENSIFDKKEDKVIYHRSETIVDSSILPVPPMPILPVPLINRKKLLKYTVFLIAWIIICGSAFHYLREFQKKEFYKNSADFLH